MDEHFRCAVRREKRRRIGQRRHDALLERAGERTEEAIVIGED
jgi:hypothetical protein